MYFFSKYIYDYFFVFKMKYVCPLGEEKFDVDKFKYNKKNLDMIQYIEVTKENLIKENKKKLGEDDEYEYYIDEEDNVNNNNNINNNKVGGVI